MFKHVKNLWIAPSVAYADELVAAANFITKKKFASLPDNEQYKGFKELAEILHTYAILEEREANES
jgi:hypothetical protein